MDVKHIGTIACGEELVGIIVTKMIDKTKNRQTDKRRAPYGPKMKLCPELSSMMISISIPRLRLKKFSLTHQSGIPLQASIRVG